MVLMIGSTDYDDH